MSHGGWDIDHWVVMESLTAHGKLNLFLALDGEVTYKPIGVMGVVFLSPFSFHGGIL